MENGYESYYIKGDELAFLLAGKKTEKFWGIDLFKQEVTKEELYRIMADLYKKDYIEWEDNYVVIKEPWKQIVQILSRATGCLQIQHEDDSKLFYFKENKIVLTEQSFRDLQTFKVTIFSKEEFIEYLWEEDFWPKEEMDAVCYEDENLDEMGAEVKTVFSFRNAKNGQLLEELTLQEKGILPVTVVKDKERRYEKEWCQNWILDRIDSGKVGEYDIS